MHASTERKFGRLGSNGMQVMSHRSVLQLTACLWTAAALAQTPAPPGGPAPPTAPTGVFGNPASPLPNPDLGSNAAFPPQRGFIRAEPVFIYPYLGVGFGYNDNLTGVSDDRIRSGFVVISPRVKMDAKSGGHTYELTFDGNFGKYFSSSANDFTEAILAARSINQFTARADLQATAFYIINQDPGGSVDRPFTGTPDRWHAGGVLATFGYGAPSAQGRLEFDAGGTDKRYTNNREFTEAFDVATWYAGARFFYRVAPNTRLLAEFRHTTYDYRSSPVDSSEERYLLGGTWDITALTSGTVKIGYITKRFKEEGIDDYAGPTGEISIRWQPRTYSNVEVFGLYAPADTTGTGVFTLDTSIGVRWEHYWRSYFLTRVFATYVNSELRGADRTDHIGRVGIGAFYDIRPWLRIGADYAFDNRNSNVPGFDFSRNVFLITIAGTL
jgi:hypothetical protein